MLLADLREKSIDELSAAMSKLANEFVSRIEEEQDSKAEVHKAYDELAAVSEVYESRAKVLQEACVRVTETLKGVQGSGSIPYSSVQHIYGILEDALERAKALGE